MILNTESNNQRRLADSSLLQVNIPTEQSSVSPFKLPSSESTTHHTQYAIPTIDQVDDFFDHVPQKAEYLHMLRQKHRFFEITPEVEVADKRLEARMEELVLECMALEEEVRKEEDEVSEVRVRRAALEGEREALKHIAKVKREAVDDSRKEFEKIRENLKPGVSTAELLTTQRNLMNLVSSKTEAEVRQIKQFLTKELEKSKKSITEKQQILKQLEQQLNKSPTAEQQEKRVKQHPEIVELHNLIQNYQRQLKRLNQAIDKRQQLSLQ